MASDRLKMHASPKLGEGRMVLAFSGWMDGGDVSTGTVEWLVDALGAHKVAEIDPEGFYIYNFPGTMEISALFRPHTKIEEGTITEFKPPSNTFYCDGENKLLLFSGKEPNLNWGDFADCIFTYAGQVGISTAYFVGSFAGMVPHTREPRLTSTVSDESMKPTLAKFGVTFATYEGPASFSTYLMAHAKQYGFSMASLVAEIPPYIEGTNPRSIEAMMKKLTAILELRLDTEDLRRVADEWEKRLNEALQSKEDLTNYISKLEEDYDNEVFDTQMGDLKEWLQKQGIRVD
ncbi:MAG: PAC2 family protein [Planctomycetota bacterium]|nr:MAG: PAC2 family protein [Planctomycetota bacterium]